MAYRYKALASDYDDTLGERGLVPPETLAALSKFQNSARRLILVTGRELPDLKAVFPHLHLFDRVVAENGGVLYRPDTGKKQVLAAPPNASFVKALKARGVRPLAVGDVIVATRQPNEDIVLGAIRDLGLELQITFNKSSVMVLPSGVNKLSGLRVALHDLDLSDHEVVGVGDAENDHAFLGDCGFSVAVRNALPSIKEMADLTTRGNRGAGVAELIDLILRDALAPPKMKADCNGETRV
jgi:HAD superfamily hydrolase (TIGR01484 family)